jgi:tetratricopeptide (TPR) repeat protein
MKYASQGKLKEAEEEFKKGLEIDSSSHNLQEVMNTINDLKNGTIKQNEALYLFKGSNYLINEQYKEAIAEFKEALRLDPENPDLYYYLGVCNYSLQEYEEAINCLKKAQVKNPNDSELNYFLGISNYSLGRYAQAITDLQKALEINPDDAQAYSIIGASNYSLGESQLAKSNLSKSKELFQKKGDYLKAAEIEEFLGAIK